MDPPECHHTIHHEKVCHRDHSHSIHYETIKEVPDIPEYSRKKLLKEAGATTAAAVEASVAVINPDLDGGYGLVIVMASFFVAFIVDGIGSSFGLLFPYILGKFGASSFVTSFSGSLFVAFVIMGSISAELVKRFGFRAVAITGSILSCIAFVASVFSPNIYVFILTFGLLGGCSCGLVFIPSIIIVNEYFHRKRGIANGIIASGSGVGLLVLAPIINVLLDMYSLSGTILFLAGVLLNMCVFSSLFRPLGENLRHAVSLNDESDQDYDGRIKESLSSNLSADNVEHFSLEVTNKIMLKDTKDGREQKVKSAFDVNEIIRKYSRIYLRKSTSDPYGSVHQGEERSKFYIKYLLHHLKPGVSTLPHHYVSSEHRYRSGNTKFQDQSRHQDTSHYKSEFHLDYNNYEQITKQLHAYSMYDVPTWFQDRDRCQILQNSLKSHKHLGDHDHHKFHSHRTSRQHSRSLSNDHGSNYYVAGSISTLLNLHNSFVHTLQESDLKAVHSGDNTSKLHNTGDTKLDCEKLIRQNSGAGENVANVDHEKFIPSSVIHEGEQEQLIHSQPIGLHKSDRSVAKSGFTSLHGDDSTDLSFDSKLASPLGYTIAQLLCMPSFHFFCLGAALIQIGYPLAGTFLAEYAYQFGLTASHIAVLMSLLGGLNICGRLLAGALVSLKMDPLLLNNVSLLLGGAACLMSPLYTEFWSLSVFASMFGFFLGFFPPLQPLIIVKHFGLDSLASAFGFLSTVKGVASILGAPLAGRIYDATGQYSMSFIFGGAVFVLSSFVHCLMICSERCRIKKKL